ncbi:hypothetical protein [Caloramator sp. Dgby_cultured_2]|nr:hypothetical protein [Caloramator sp. Dgby_cultured_2]WDU83320.1 hypothetical protein PWK10_00885 [Caloramator sp. Dgby_cultured_2]
MDNDIINLIKEKLITNINPKAIILLDLLLGMKKKKIRILIY